MSDITIVYAILVGAVILFVTGRVPVGLVAIGVALALWATGILPLATALSGFGDPTVLFIASLFVVSEGLDATGVTAWAGAQLVERAGQGRARLVLFTMLLVAALTAVISVNGAVAALLPVVVVIAIRTGRAPSQLLMPLVFGAHAGSMLTLTGTPVNVIVSTYAAEITGQGFGFFEFALAGIPLMIGCTAVVLLLGPRLLPERRPKSMPADLSRHARTLVEQYDLGRSEVAHELAAVGSDATHVDLAAALVGPGSGLAEIMIPPRSPLVGETAFPGMVTESGDAVVLATGGNGLIFGKSTNSVINTGSAAAEAFKAGAKYANGEFIQVHPTAIPGDDKLRLMSESIRGEGGRVWVPSDGQDGRPPKGEPWYFLETMFPAYGNLVPRDIATRAIFKVCVDMGLGVNGKNSVYLDVTHIDAAVLDRKLGGVMEIYEKFVGDDPRKVPMKIFPAVHYSMGGLWVG